MARTQTHNRRRRVHLPNNAIRQIATGTPVQVNWIDTVTESNWVSKEDFVAQEPIECITVGIWMKPGANCVHIATNINENSCDGTTIPIGCVLRVKVLHGKGNQKQV